MRRRRWLVVWWSYYDLFTRTLLVDYIPKIVYADGKVELHGTVPVQVRVCDDPENMLTETSSKIEFCINGMIDRGATRSPKLG